MYGYRGLTSGQTDDISFKEVYALEDEEDVGPAPGPKIHNRGTKKFST